MNITFYGAAREVTGSCSLLESKGFKLLVDCGMFQGGEFNERKNAESLPFFATDLNAVLVTHAHLDHTGRLPLLVRAGYQGFFYCTPAAVQLTALILEDALEVMTHNNRKFGVPILFDAREVADTMDRFKPVDYDEEFTCGGDLKIRFHEAGHIFGSAFVEVTAENKRVVFSGDIGNVNVPIIRDTASLPADVDALVCESTYGDRLHESTAERQQLLEKMVLDGVSRGGVLMIPSFALERTQELLYDLNDLIDRKHKLPRLPIFLDSPLAIAATRVYRQFPQYYDQAATRLVKDGDDLFQFPGLTLCESREASKSINNVPAPKIIIAGAGMMNGGRILHHALRYLSDPNSTLLIIGYQAHGTLGRAILDGAPTVGVMGEKVTIHCRVKAIGALSAHGDQEKLLNWIGGGGALPKKVYLNHGEPTASETLAKRLNEDFGLKATVVDFGLNVKV